MPCDEVILRGSVLDETEKAYFFAPDKGDATWLPKGECDWSERSHEMTIPRWLAETRDLEE